MSTVVHEDKTTTNNMNPIDFADYIIVITGPIGVGKTTTYNKVCQELSQTHANVKQVREYIDGKDQLVSQFLLGKYLQKELSDACFQNYIQSYYVNELTPEKLSGKIVLMERCMSDSVGIFCNIANKKGNLSNLDFTIMFDNCISEDVKVQAPNYFKKNFELSVIRTDESADKACKQIINIIEDDLANGIKRRVIGLTNTVDVCYDRMYNRARTAEDAYRREDIENNCRAYDRLYELINDESIDQIRLVDLGYLLRK